MPPKQERHPGLTVIATVSGIMNAEILKSKLEDAGIPVLLDYESAGIVFGITASGLKLSQVRILVTHDDAELAEQILNEPPPPGWEEQATQASPDT
jgi:hypothetical protein